jgi:hypothetical protein
VGDLRRYGGVLCFMPIDKEPIEEVPEGDDIECELCREPDCDYEY